MFYYLHQDCSTSPDEAVHKLLMMVPMVMMIVTITISEKPQGGVWIPRRPHRGHSAAVRRGSKGRTRGPRRPVQGRPVAGIR